MIVTILIRYKSWQSEIKFFCFCSFNFYIVSLLFCYAVPPLDSHIMHINYGEIYLLSCTLHSLHSGGCLKIFFYLFIRKIYASYESVAIFFVLWRQPLFIFIFHPLESFFPPCLLLNSLKNFFLFYCCWKLFLSYLLSFLFPFLHDITFRFRVINKLSFVSSSTIVINIRTCLTKKFFLEEKNLQSLW